MSAPRQRRWFQLHLSTVIVLTLAAGVALFINASPRPAKPDRDFKIVIGQFEAPEEFQVRFSMLWYASDQKGTRYGWPILAAGQFNYRNSDVMVVNWVGVILDSSIAVSALLMLTIACEYYIRRRRGKQVALAQ
jgi:hypothetical protein